MQHVYSKLLASFISLPLLEYAHVYPDLLHSKRVSLFMVQIFLQVEEGVKEYVSHPAALQITQGYLTWRKNHGVWLFSREE